ncbi:MAG: hypothetical protein FWE20_05550 [Defluviitaleaceae bacterium]|nr:hypothetical protein [Defluviitaleaceae bacterium]
MSERCGGFLLSLSTQCGVKLLAGGLCRVGYEERSRNDLRGLSRIEFRENDDIYDIDYRLARAVVEGCGDYVWAVGVTANLPNMPMSTGGVIGSPHRDIVSAEARAEYIGHGLYMRAFPGGPGCVAMCGGEYVLQYFEFELYSQDKKAEALSEYLHKQCVETFLVVTDGAGPHAKGSVILMVDGKRSHIGF